MVTEGRPEEWLNRVEDAMFATTKKHLYKVLEDSKGEWVGQTQRRAMSPRAPSPQRLPAHAVDRRGSVRPNAVCLVRRAFVLQPPRRRSGSRTTRAR